MALRHPVVRQFDFRALICNHRQDVGIIVVRPCPIADDRVFPCSMWQLEDLRITRGRTQHRICDIAIGAFENKFDSSTRLISIRIRQCVLLA